jgi:hypothetical protein
MISVDIITLVLAILLYKFSDRSLRGRIVMLELTLCISAGLLLVAFNLWDVVGYSTIFFFRAGVFFFALFGTRLVYGSRIVAWSMFVAILFNYGIGIEYYTGHTGFFDTVYTPLMISIGILQLLYLTGLSNGGFYIERYWSRFTGWVLHFFIRDNCGNTTGANP